MRKKIVILTYSLGGAGAERMVANLVNQLDRDKYDIHLVLMNTEIEYDILPDQKIHYIEKSYRYENEFWKLIKLPFLAWKFKRYCNQQQIDLVLAVMNRPNLIAGMAKSLGINAKVLISERFYTPYYYNSNTLAGKIKLWLLKTFYPKADSILPNSQGTVEALQDYKIQSEYAVVKNPTDIQRIGDLSKLPLPRPMDFAPFTFINVATFREEKNHDLLVDAVEGIRDLPFRLLLIGKGNLLEPIKQKVRSLQLQDKIIFLDFTENPYQYMSRAQCFILSSLGEGFPNVLIESMVCGLPIISVDCKTGPRELLAPGTRLDTDIAADHFEVAEYGILTRYNSKTSLQAAMRWALQHPGNLHAYQEKGRMKSGDYEITKVCAEFSVIFDSFLKK